jgi:hypothetical protein
MNNVYSKFIKINWILMTGLWTQNILPLQMLQFLGQNLDIITIIIVAASNTARAVAHYLQ